MKKDDEDSRDGYSELELEPELGGMSSATNKGMPRNAKVPRNGRKSSKRIHKTKTPS